MPTGVALISRSQGASGVGHFLSGKNANFRGVLEPLPLAAFAPPPLPMITTFLPSRVEPHGLQRGLDAMNVGVVACPFPSSSETVLTAPTAAAAGVRRDMNGIIAILCGIVTEKPLEPDGSRVLHEVLEIGCGQLHIRKVEIRHVEGAIVQDR